VIAVDVGQIERPGREARQHVLGAGLDEPDLASAGLQQVAPGPPIWLIVRKSLAKNPEVKYYVSNADEQTPLETMALVTGTRWRVEEFFEDGKGDFGMADYEARAWTSWHHHMTMVALAHLFITTTRHEMQQEIPELTLPHALELMQATLGRPTLTAADAMRLTEYHLERNRVARTSHHKSWKRKHKRLKPKPLL